MKQCTKCGETKPPSEFYKHKDGKDGLRADCKQCQRSYQNNKYVPSTKVKKTKEEVRAAQKAYYIANREKITAQIKIYRAANKDKYNEYMRNYSAKPENREKAKAYFARPDIKAKMKAYHREYRKSKTVTNR